MYKNVSGQKVYVYAYNQTTGAPATGDAANITAQISKDAATSAATNDTNPAELDATDHPGVYVFDMTVAETNADVLMISAVSSTANVVIEPIELRTIEPHYWAEIEYRRDESNAQDEYAVTWFRDSNVQLAAAVGSPTIEVEKMDGTTLVASTAMTEVGSFGTCKYTESTNRQTVGESYKVVVTASIDGATRTHVQTVGRD